MPSVAVRPLRIGRVGVTARYKWLGLNDKKSTARFIELGVAESEHSGIYTGRHGRSKCGGYRAGFAGGAKNGDRRMMWIPSCVD